MIQTHLPNQAGRKIAVAAIAPLRAPLRFDEIQLEHRFADRGPPLGAAHTDSTWPQQRLYSSVPALAVDAKSDTRAIVARCGLPTRTAAGLARPTRAAIDARQR